VASDSIEINQYNGAATCVSISGNQSITPTGQNFLLGNTSTMALEIIDGLSSINANNTPVNSVVTIETGAINTVASCP